jgi:hypothetical protein
MSPEVPGKFEESDVFFTHVIQDPNRTRSSAGQPEDFPSRAAEFSLQRHHLFSRRVKTLLEKLLENVHEDVTKITLNLATERVKQRQKQLLGFEQSVPLDVIREDPQAQSISLAAFQSDVAQILPSAKISDHEGV